MDDYRYCIKVSLAILEELRNKLTDDSIHLAPDIRTALHKSGDNQRSVRDLYFLRYCVSWLDSHWKLVQRKLNEDTKHSIDEKRKMIQLFAEHFKDLLGKCLNTEIFFAEIIPSILETQNAAIDEMLKSAEKNDENFRRLYSEMAKHEEWFERKIKEQK